MSNTTQEMGKKDIFAEIATQRNEFRSKALVEPQPPKLGNKILESKKSDPKASFKPLVKMETKIQLEKELESERKRVKAFMDDLAPRLETCREAIPLTTFDWRLEENKEWKKVQIPHYGGPLGRATAFYKTAFKLDKKQIEGKACWIRFNGVDYKGHVFVNGNYLGSHEGFFAPFEFDFTKWAKEGENELLVRVENDAICLSNDSWGKDGNLYEGDKIYAATGMGYNDPEIGWHHCPPGMGIYQEVAVEIREKMHIADIFVRPFLAQKQAEVWIEVESTYITREDATVEFSIFGQNFKQATLKEKHKVNVGPTRNYYRYSVSIPNPKAWDLDEPWLYQVQAKLLDKDGKKIDTRKRQFGMRDFRLETEKEPKGMFTLNGRRLRLRGANEMGYVQQCVAKKEWGKLRDAILLGKIANMNFVRLTQRPVQDEVYEMCDKLGFMTQTDLPLFGMMRRNQFCEGVRQAGEMERLVRAHPSNVVVTYINEPFPSIGSSGKGHRQMLNNELESFFRACDEAILMENPDRVIKAVDGDYDPPHEGLPDNHCYNCWYNGHGLPLGKLIKGYWQKIKTGWNYGCGEFGAEGLDPVETMYKYYPKDWLPTRKDEKWFPSRIIQAQTGRFHYMWFTTQRTLEEWVRESQRFQAWGTRTMTEAFRRDARMVSIAIHLFIDAFPSGWMKSIMDVDCNPKPAYFEYREALAPVATNIQTDRDSYVGGEKLDMNLWVCNDLDTDLKGYEICYQLRRGDRVIFSAKHPAVIGALMPTFQGKIAIQLPDVLERTQFSVEMAVKDNKGKIVHDTARPIEIFPRRTIKPVPVYILGSKKGPAWNLAEELGLKPIPWIKTAKGVILSDSIGDVRKNNKYLEKALKAGSRVVVTDVEKVEPDFELAGARVKLEEAGMGNRYFVNCMTGHSLVEGFDRNDFFMWHNSNTDLIEPILPITMTAEGMETVLLSGNGQWGMDEWRPTQAAGKKRWGDGVLIVSLVQLSGRTKTNPVAKEYACRILGI
jgi:hypothetical protein